MELLSLESKYIVARLCMVRINIDNRCALSMPLATDIYLSTACSLCHFDDNNDIDNASANGNGEWAIYNLIDNIYCKIVT